MAMTIGQLAARAGVNLQTVRYYERRGLMPEPARTPSGYRQYLAGSVDRLRFIKRAQELGFTLEEIAGLLALRIEHVPSCGTVETQAREKIEVVERKMAELASIRRTLEQLVEACKAREPTAECPILEALEERAS